MNDGNREDINSDAGKEIAANALWFYRALITVMLTLLGTGAMKGCEFRDDTRDRLNKLEQVLDLDVQSKLKGIYRRLDTIEEDLHRIERAESAKDRARSLGVSKPDQ